MANDHRPAAFPRRQFSFRPGWVCLAVHLLAWLIWIFLSRITADHLGEWGVIYVGTGIVMTSSLNRLLTGWLATQSVLAVVGIAAAMKERLLHLPLLSYDVVFFLQNIRHNFELLAAYPLYSCVGGGAIGAAVFTILRCAYRERPAVVIRQTSPGLAHLFVATVGLFLVFGWWSHPLGHFKPVVNAGILQESVDFMETREVNVLPRFF